MAMIFKPYDQSLVPQIVELWNACFSKFQGFYPMTAEAFTTQIASQDYFRPEYLLVVQRHYEAVGFVHFSVIDEPEMARTGVINAIGVHPDYRNHGTANELLTQALKVLSRQRIEKIEGTGAWPFSTFYGGMINGSERSGITKKNKAGLWLFKKHGFRQERESIIMQLDLFGVNFPENDRLIYTMSRQGKQTWLDYCFRIWDLHDHAMLSEDAQMLSRAVFAKMDGYSAYRRIDARAIFSVFTPEPLRRQGYAKEHLKLLLMRLKNDGAQRTELHVYADNEPALNLYRSLGFNEIGRAVSLVKPIAPGI